MINMIKKGFILFLIFTLNSCKTNEVNGIIIGDTLFTNQSYSENKELKNIIEKCLNKDSKGFLELSRFNCGDGAGCYDLGYVLTQILYRIGEEEYIESIKNLDKNTQTQLSGFIEVGLEYGDNYYNDEQDNLKLENEFPKIYALTKSK